MKKNVFFMENGEKKASDTDSTFYFLAFVIANFKIFNIYIFCLIIYIIF